MVSNGTRHMIDAALADPAESAGKGAVDADFPRSLQDAVVFIVDDDVAVREALHSLLRDVRLQAEVFGSPAELLASKLPDAASCLVLDIRLPGVGGLDFQAELARAKIDIPIIFMTGYADIPMAARAGAPVHHTVHCKVRIYQIAITRYFDLVVLHPIFSEWRRWCTARPCTSAAPRREA